MATINNNLTDHTAKELEMIELYKRGDDIKEIATAYGYKSVSSLYRVLSIHGVPLRSTNKVAQGNYSKPLRIEYEPVNNVDEMFDRVERKEDHKGNKKFRVTIKVRLEITADTMEGAIAKAKGYNGYNEVLSVSRIG